MDIFILTPTPPRMQNAELARDDWHFKIMSITICLIFFGAQLNILLSINVKIIKLINVHTGAPNWCGFC
jgi:hypothetical protein